MAPRMARHKKTVRACLSADLAGTFLPKFYDRCTDEIPLDEYEQVGIERYSGGQAQRTRVGGGVRNESLRGRAVRAAG